MTTTIDAFVPTVTNGTTTYYEPFTTSFSAPQACSTYFLGDEFANGSTTSLDALTAWSPWYQVYVNDSAGCLPDAVVSSETEYESWFSASLSSLLVTTTSSETTVTAQVTTLFAPFACFDGWEVVYSSVLSEDSTLTQSVCCPTQYNAQINTIGLGDYNGVDVTKKTVQCVSTLFPTATLTYATLASESSDSSTTTSAETHSADAEEQTLTVTAIAYTGYNIATPTDSSDGGDDSGDSSASVADGNGSSGLSSGAKAGIGVGVAGGVVLIGVAFVLWFLRRRRQQQQQQLAGSKSSEAEAAAGFLSEDKKGGGNGEGVLGPDKGGLKTDGLAEMQGNDAAVLGMQEMHNGVDRPELMGSGQVFAQELEGSYEWPVPELDGGVTVPARELDGGATVHSQEAKSNTEGGDKKP